MFEVLEASVKPLMLNMRVLEVAYELYLSAPQSSSPVIDLRTLSRRTGKGLLECRNAIVEANKLGRFPDCSLKT
ncbi:MAG: hypothetical protein VKK04_10105 [Synechococcales bacterium]|nr:hypothetical protein [Synechococcales bacterium]